MKMQKRQFRIGQLAHYLKVEKFVIRFWEKEFEMKSARSTGGQRFYDQKDIERFKIIKELLYQKGFTIAGAKQQLKERSKRKQALLEEDSKILGSHKTTLEHTVNTPQPTREELEQQIVDLQKKLLKLRELL
jgi:DNA-binding transcriptional MerR regulator